MTATATKLGMGKIVIKQIHHHNVQYSCPDRFRIKVGERWLFKDTLFPSTDGLHDFLQSDWVTLDETIAALNTYFKIPAETPYKLYERSRNGASLDAAGIGVSCLEMVRPEYDAFVCLQHDGGINIDCELYR